MKEFKLKLHGLSYSQSQVGSYVAILSQVRGKKKIPVIIKATDAQYLASRMEDYKSNVPLTQDLLKILIDSFNANLVKLSIYGIVEGLFFTKMILETSSKEEFEINCSIGDLISLSVVYNIPIFCDKSVMDSVGIEMESDGTTTEEQDKKNKKNNNENLSIDRLEKILEKALEEEDFEIAIQIRDKINALKEKNITK